MFEGSTTPYRDQGACVTRQTVLPTSSATSNAPYRIFNIGNSDPVHLSVYVEAIEQALGKKAIREFLPLQPGDVPNTYADVSALVEAVGYRPSTPVREGVSRFVSWYRDYFAGKA